MHFVDKDNLVRNKDQKPTIAAARGLYQNALSIHSWPSLK